LCMVINGQRNKDDAITEAGNAQTHGTPLRDPGESNGPAPSLTKLGLQTKR